MTARDQVLQMFKLGLLSLEERASPSGCTGPPAPRSATSARRLDESRGARGPRVDPFGHVLLQLLGVPVAAGQLGHRPAVPDHADPPARRAPTRKACSPTSPATRTARSTVRQPARRQAHARAARPGPGQEYYLAAFLVGAYQETLGDLHNLFGDTHVVHIRLHDEGGWWIEEIVKGDTANKVLEYMEYDVEELYPALARDCERAVREARMTVAESQALKRFYEGELNGYAYLEP
jgi:arginine decarboxylase